MKVYQKPRYHQWRWNELVGPLVNQDGRDRMFLDLGCNAGFYMQKALKLGYKTIGVEKDPGYLAQVPEDLDVIKGDINYYKPHCAYLTLLACVHYHQSDEQVEALFHNLLYSTAYLLVMGRHRGRVKSKPNKKHLLKKLNGWPIVDYREAKAFYTVLFKNPRYEELSVDELYNSTKKYVSKIPNFVDFIPSFEDFVKKTIDDIDFDPSSCDFMKYLKHRRFKYQLGRCWIYKVMIKELQSKGLHTALWIRDGHILDGFHRLIILRELGIKRVICAQR
jgi:SAM-dependent methyltransferase